MPRALIALALLLMSSGTRAEEYHVIGSVCEPTKEAGKGPVCATWYAPVGYRLAKSFHEELPWENRLKGDRLVPLNSVTAQAAPK